MALPALLLSAAVLTWAVDPSTEGALVEDHRVPLVTVVVELPAGTWSPWGVRSDIATAFASQDDDPERALRRRADALGVSIELGVGRRDAVARVTARREDLPEALDALRAIFANRDLDERELTRARRESAVLWKQTDTDVGFKMMQAAARELYGDDDPRRREWERPPQPSTDVEALVEARDRLLRLPGRLIGFAGDLTLEEAKELAGDLLPQAADAPADLAPKLSPITPSEGRARERVVAIRKLTQVYLAYVRDSLRWDDPRRSEFLVADHVLGGHFYSRLFVALRHEGGETYGAGTREDGDVVPGLYGASSFTRAENAERLEAKLLETMRTFRERGITEEERRDAVSALTGTLAFARQSPGQILGRYRRERRLGLPPGSLDAAVERARGLTLDEINAFIREFYDPAAFSMIKAVPR